MKACRQGHELTPENTYVRPTGEHCCRACERGRRRLRTYTEKRKVVDFVCPDCLMTREISERQVLRITRGEHSPLCEACRRPVSLPHSEAYYREWWLSLYSMAEIHVLARDLIPMDIHEDDLFQKEAA